MTVLSDRTNETLLQDQPDAHNARALKVAVALLLAVVLGLGTWLIVTLRADDEAAMPAAVERVLDDYVAAWQAGDADAFLATVVPEFTGWVGAHQHVGETLINLTEPRNADQIAAGIRAEGGRSRGSVIQSSPAMVRGSYQSRRPGSAKPSTSTARPAT